MTKLHVQDLRVSYGTNEILKGVSVELNKGEVIVLLGPSGSGKTTMLRAIAGLEEPRAGLIQIDGKTVFDGAAGLDVPAEKRNLGLVFQSYALWPHRTVFENVAYGLRLQKLPDGDVKTRVGAALSELGLGDLSQRYPHQLSGGQQQRVAIARALVYKPPLVLMDEPLSNLDARLREEAKAWLRALILELQLSAVVVTHDQSEAMAMADRIVLLSDGDIEQAGTPEEIYTQPRTLFCAEFFGVNNRLEGRVERTTGNELQLSGDGWTIVGTGKNDLTPGDAAVGIIRIERLKLVDSAGSNRLAVEPVASMFMGDHWQHLLRLGSALVRVNGPSAISGRERWIETLPSDVWVFKRRD